MPAKKVSMVYAQRLAVPGQRQQGCGQEEETAPLDQRGVYRKSNLSWCCTCMARAARVRCPRAVAAKSWDADVCSLDLLRFYLVKLYYDIPSGPLDVEAGRQQNKDREQLAEVAGRLGSVCGLR